MQYEYSTPTFITHDSLSQFQHGIICLIICWLHQETLVSHNKKHVENGTKWLGTSSLRTAHVKQPHPSHISFHNQFVHESTHLASCICGILLYSLMLCCMRVYPPAEMSFLVEELNWCTHYHWYCIHLSMFSEIPVPVVCGESAQLPTSCLWLVQAYLLPRWGGDRAIWTIW